MTDLLVDRGADGAGEGGRVAAAAGVALVEHLGPVLDDELLRDAVQVAEFRARLHILPQHLEGFGHEAICIPQFLDVFFRFQLGVSEHNVGKE